MAVLHGFVGSTTVSGEAAPAPISLPAPALLSRAPNQNRHATQASVYCVPFESKRQPGSSFWNPQHRTELIVNLKQPHKSPLGGHLGIFWVGMCRLGLQIDTPF